jgi:3,4-dihydroxy 2-butanone 4-phosphate synthase / GTP cyclohydrolase II
MTNFSTIETALSAIRQGKMVIVVDSPDRENEGDFIMAAEWVTPEAVTFMAEQARTLITLSIDYITAKRLELMPLTQTNTSLHSTPFAMTVDAREHTTTGSSAFDRALTIKKIVDPSSSAGDFARPGHVFPLIARDGGVLQRVGHTEAAYDLARLSGCKPAGLLSEIMMPSGKMACLPELIELGRKFGMPIITIEDLIVYRLRNERTVVPGPSESVGPAGNQWTLHRFHDVVDGTTHQAFVFGDIARLAPVPVRVEAGSVAALFTLTEISGKKGSIHSAVEIITKAGAGVIVIINRPQPSYENTLGVRHNAEAEFREYGTGVQILLALGISTVKVITYKVKDYVAIEGFGIEITGTIVPTD